MFYWPTNGHVAALPMIILLASVAWLAMAYRVRQVTKRLYGCWDRAEHLLIIINNSTWSSSWGTLY